MQHTTKLAACALALFGLAPPAAEAQSQVCRVADPTGTPLNIRLSPNGEVVERVRNGERILVMHGDGVVDKKGRLWYSVALMDSAAPDGYVLAAYVKCN